MSSTLPTICESLQILVACGLPPESISKTRGRDLARTPEGWQITTEETTVLLPGQGARAVRVLRSWSRGGPDQPLFSLTPGSPEPAPEDWIHTLLSVLVALGEQVPPRGPPSAAVLARMGTYYAWLGRHPETFADPIFLLDGKTPADVAGQALWCVARGLSPQDARYHAAQAAAGSGFLLLARPAERPEVLGVLRWLDTQDRSSQDLWHFLLRRPERIQPWCQFYEEIREQGAPERQRVADRLPPVDPHALSRSTAQLPEEPVDWNSVYRAWVEEGHLENDPYAFLIYSALKDIPRPWHGSDVADYYEALAPAYRGRVFRVRWNRLRTWLLRTAGIVLAKTPGSRKGDASAVSLPLDAAQAVVALSDRIPAAQLSRARWSDVVCDERRVPGDRMRWVMGSRQTLLGVQQERALDALRAWAFAEGKLVEDVQGLILPVRPGARIPFTPAAIRFLVREARKDRLAGAIRYPIRVTGPFFDEGESAVLP